MTTMLDMTTGFVPARKLKVALSAALAPRPSNPRSGGAFATTSLST
jgi:hypothetical protein